MLVYILVPLLVAVVGAFAFIAAKTNAEIKELGRLCFACGLLVTLLWVCAHYVRLP